MDKIALTNASWQLCMQNSLSATTYLDRIEIFVRWSESIHSLDDFHAKLIQYFQFEKDKLCEDTSSGVKPPISMRGWVSIFKKWYFHLGHGDLTEKLPIIEQNLNMWEKSHVVLKASTFDSQDLQKFHNLPNTSSTILLKCFSVLAIAFAARGCEIYHLDWNNIKKVLWKEKLIISYLLITQLNCLSK